MSPSSRVLERPDEVALVRAQWDELAVEAEKPFSAPAWAMSWWSNLGPRGARLRVVAVTSGDRLVGVVPFYCHGRSYMPLGKGLAPAEPLAAVGMEREVAEAAAASLANASPRPATIRLEQRGSSPEWASLLGDAWPGGRPAWRWAKSETPVPRVDLGAGFDAWLAAKSSSFRRETKRKKRRLEEAGGSFRYASAESLERDVREFMRLHRDRLAGQGGTRLTDEGVERALIAVGAEMLASGRFRLLCLDVDGSPVGAQVLLVAGREVSAWNSGFDEGYAKLSPSMQCIVQALTDASEHGERTMDLGPGAQEYKYRLSDGEDSYDTRLLVPPGRGYRLARFRVGAERTGQRLAERLSPGAKRRLRRLVGR
jgi:CelD/BcsL family acetyltransferase involved in cellulose biosynthesis